MRQRVSTPIPSRSRTEVSLQAIGYEGSWAGLDSNFDVYSPLARWRNRAKHCTNGKLFVVCSSPPFHPPIRLANMALLKQRHTTEVQLRCFLHRRFGFSNKFAVSLHCKIGEIQNLWSFLPVK